MSKKNNLRNTLSFGFEQTFTIPQWWSEEGFTATSDTPLKREKMLDLAKAIAAEVKGSYKESLDIWDHLQYEVFDGEGNESFVVTMDPGSIEVKTPPVLLAQVKEMAKPLFIAADKAQVVPYRNWWYGIQGGTEGGCHVNMGGLTPKSNPLRQEPELVVKYAAFIHNRPFLHYPFMSIDVGPEGNAMRMDEKKGFDDVLSAFKTFKNSTPTNNYAHFEKTNLISEKASFPSLFKFKAPLFLIEDRGQEALRSADEFELVSELRMQIFEYLQTQDHVEELHIFEKELHTNELTSYFLWGEFQKWANYIGINPVPYQCFFDRQFPTLWMGKTPPQNFGLKEGRRPRKITEIKKRGDVVVSKTVDTRYKRFEVFYSTLSEEQFDIAITSKGIEFTSDMTRHSQPLGFGDKGIAYYKYFDIITDKEQPIINLQLKDKLSDEIVEEVRFDTTNMQWV